MTERGLYGKYEVRKDGEVVTGPVFVLRPDRDPAAAEALRYYATRTLNDTLSADIFVWLNGILEK